ncbi:LuxR C-terminal-related transcriptional regulator [Sphingobium sp. TomMM35A]
MKVGTGRDDRGCRAVRSRHDPARCRPFALAPTEGAIAAALANGASLWEAARRPRTAENTVRAHLHSIFSKLGINRQLQLVHLIHTSFPETL